MDTVVNRLVRYAKVYSESDYYGQSGTPSAQREFDMARLLEMCIRDSSFSLLSALSLPCVASPKPPFRQRGAFFLSIAALGQLCPCLLYTSRCV